MIELEDKGRTVVLAALRAASRQVGLTVAGGQAEPGNERYRRVDAPPEAWAIAGNRLAGATCEFLFSGPVGMVDGWFLVDDAGDVILRERFPQPYDFSLFGGRLRVLPVFEIPAPTAGAAATALERTAP